MKRGLVLIPVFLVVLFLIFISGFSGKGTGTPGDPYQITNCTELQEINDNLSASYILTNKIDCSDTAKWNDGAGFLPIGDPSGSGFTGVLDGQNYEITNLYINRAQLSCGLFSFVAGGSISNINLNNESVLCTGSTYVGGLVGFVNGGSITNVSTSGEVGGGIVDSAIDSYGNTGVGGVIGRNLFVSVGKTSSTAKVTGTENVGGLIGKNYGDITESFASGTVTGKDSGSTGALVGLYG